MNFRTCPSIFRLTDPARIERLRVFAARTATPDKVINDVPGRLQGYMPRLVGEEGTLQVLQSATRDGGIHVVGTGRPTRLTNRLLNTTGP